MSTRVNDMISFAAPAIQAVASKPPSVEVRNVANQQDLSNALCVRRRVFVDEMGIPANEEFDTFDQWPLPTGITHFLVTVDKRPIATCRVNTSIPPGARLERMAVDKVARRNGVGLALLKHIEKSKVIEDTRGPFYCYAMKDKELFYRNSGWVVEDGHGAVEDAGIPHVAMIKRRRPQGANNLKNGSLSHTMIRTWDIRRARRFYSLLGFQDETRFLTNNLKAAWIQSPWIDQKIELIEVRDLAARAPEPDKAHGAGSLAPGLGHLSFDLSRSCTDLTKFLITMQNESVSRFNTKLRILDKPRQIMLGSKLIEVAFMTDADGTVIELMRFVKHFEDKLDYDAQW